MKTVRVDVVELTILGRRSYHAACRRCNWRSVGYYAEDSALKQAKQHGAEHAKRDQAKKPS